MMVKVFTFEQKKKKKVFTSFKRKILLTIVIASIAQLCLGLLGNQTKVSDLGFVYLDELGKK